MSLDALVQTTLNIFCVIVPDSVSLEIFCCSSLASLTSSILAIFSAAIWKPNGFFRQSFLNSS